MRGDLQICMRGHFTLVPIRDNWEESHSRDKLQGGVPEGMNLDGIALYTRKAPCSVVTSCLVLPFPSSKKVTRIELHFEGQKIGSALAERDVNCSS